MASGTITLSKSGSGSLGGRISWESTSNGTEANTSTVTAKIQVRKPNGYTTTGTWKGSLTVGGTTKSISWYGSIDGDWETLKTVTATVPHNADGSGSCYIYGKISGPTETTVEGTSVSKSATVELDTIPRYASILTAPDFNDEENPTITYSNPAGSAVTALEACIAVDGSAKVVYRSIDTSGSSYTFVLTNAERNALRTATTGSNSRTVVFYVRSTIGSTTEHSTLSKTFTIKNPDPTINPTIVDSNSTTVGLTGNSSKLVKYYSNVTITIGASAVKGASLTSQKVTCGNKSLTANGTISAVETNSFVFTATDDRGNITTKTVTPSFVEYVKLTCNLENNMPDASGNMAVKATGNYFNGSFGAKNNSLQVYYRYKTAGGSYSSWKAMSVTLSGNNYSALASVTGLDYQTNYVFQAYAVDALATVYSTEKAVKATPVFDWSENDFKFNVPVNLGDGCDIYKNGEVAYAPDGFGLGKKVAPSTADINVVTPARFFRTTSSTANLSQATSNVGIAIPYSENEVAQLLIRTSTGSVRIRRFYSGKWIEEWVNPPLDTGVEYLTTERYNGYPVYKKVVHLGKISANATTDIVHGIEGVDWTIDCKVFDTLGTLNDVATSVRFTKTNITVTLPSGIGNRDALALISYVK